MGAHGLPADFCPRRCHGVGHVRRILPPAADQTVSQWADANRMLSGKSSSEPGPWRTDRTPYLRQIMDDLSAPAAPCGEVVVMFAAQLGKSRPATTGWATSSTTSPAPSCACSHHRHGQSDSAASASPPCWRNARLRRKVRENHWPRRPTPPDEDFAGGVLVVSGANGAASLRSMPVRYLFLDEPAPAPQDVDGGLPIVLAEKRTRTFRSAQGAENQHPTIKHL